MDREGTLSLAVEILSFNRQEALLVNLSTMLNYSIARETHIVVVDNGSTDGSAEALKEMFGDFTNIQTVLLESNTGVGLAATLAISGLNLT